MRTKFHDKMETLKTSVIDMGALVYENVKMCSEALFTENKELAKKVSENPEKWYKWDQEIEEKCVQLIALQQPMATDLRRLFVYIGISTDYDRMGRLLGHIADIVLHHATLKIHPDLKKMFDVVQSMIEVTNKSLRNEDVTLLENLTKMDDEVDALFEKIFNESIQSMSNSCNHIHVRTELLFAARWLERLGDHACRIGERVIYVVEGIHKRLT